MRDRLELRLPALLIDGFFKGSSALARRQPLASPRLWSVDVERNVTYGPDPAHRLDIYRPRSGGLRARPMPALMYVHGGAFRMLSKDSHFMMAIAFARAGFVVFNVDYRLAPAHRYPTPLEDCARARAWIHDCGRRYGADPDMLVLAGESAGANLVTALTVASCFDRPEQWTHPLRDLPAPRAVAPACGVLQVSDIARMWRRRDLPGWIIGYSRTIPESYLGDEHAQPDPARALADPLLIIESDDAPHRPLPPFFVGVGTADPLLDDSRRLGHALSRRDVAHEVRYYPGEGHAFHALVFKEQARALWRDKLRFLRHQLSAGRG